MLLMGRLDSMLDRAEELTVRREACSSDGFLSKCMNTHLND